MVDLSVKIGNLTFANPIMPASGAFSTDLAQIMDINRLGALVAKTVSREYRIGNPTPRVAELECGMINSIGRPCSDTVATSCSGQPRREAARLKAEGAGIVRISSAAIRRESVAPTP